MTKQDIDFLATVLLCGFVGFWAAHLAVCVLGW